MLDLSIDDAWRIMAERTVSVATLEEMGADPAAAPHPLERLGYDVVMQWDGYTLRHRGRVLSVQAGQRYDAWMHAVELQRVDG
mgnify:CR=1 FL=1